MLYLALQMAFLLVAASLIGVAVGWFLNRFKQQPITVEPDDRVRDDDLYALKNRLDKCFDDNSALRRDLKAKDAQLGNTGSKLVDSSDSNELGEKLQALMDDLQLRDDTILALENELKVARDDGGS